MDILSITFILVIIVVLPILTGYSYTIMNSNKNKEIQHLSESDLEPFPNSIEKQEIDNIDEFINEIVLKYQTYDDFIKSKDFDDYFPYWNTHKQYLDKVRYSIEHKPKSSLIYKIIKY